MELRALPAQTQFPPLSTDITVVFRVIAHVLHSSDLFLESAALLLLVVCWFNEAQLPVGFKIQVIVDTLISPVKEKSLDIYPKREIKPRIVLGLDIGRSRR